MADKYSDKYSISFRSSFNKRNRDTRITRGQKLTHTLSKKNLKSDLFSSAKKMCLSNMSSSSSLSSEISSSTSCLLEFAWFLSLSNRCRKSFQVFDLHQHPLLYFLQIPTIPKLTSSGSSLHLRICSELGSEFPYLVIGRGKKSSLLTPWFDQRSKEI